MFPRRENGWTGVLVSYLAAVLFAAVALFGRWLLDPWLGNAQELSLLFGAIALSVWYSGPGPAVLAAVLGYIGSDFLFIQPRGVLAIIDVQEATGLGTYTLACAVIIGFGHGMRTANQRARDTARRLEQSKAELEQAERHKDDFLATLAHELRGPLSSIRTAAHLLQHRDSETGPARGIIERQVSHLARLVDDLLDISRIRAGCISIHRESMDLADSLRQALEAAATRMDEAGHELHVDIPPERLIIDGDPTRVTQIFTNLLTNAARYTPRGGRVDVRVQHEGEEARVSVRDNGIGIPADALGGIFDMYRQVDRAAERRSGGLGIGLALVRQLVDLHGGRVEVRSEGAGKGSEFVVILPLSRKSGGLATPVAATADATADAAREGAQLRCASL